MQIDEWNGCRRSAIQKSHIIYWKHLSTTMLWSADHSTAQTLIWQLLHSFWKLSSFCLKLFHSIAFLFVYYICNVMKVKLSQSANNSACDCFDLKIETCYSPSMAVQLYDELASWFSYIIRALVCVCVTVLPNSVDIRQSLCPKNLNCHIHSWLSYTENSGYGS
jgi:hypothetical protein